MSKRCTRCHERLPATPEWFFRRLTGLQAVCKACHLEFCQEWRRRHPEQVQRYKAREIVHQRARRAARRVAASDAEATG